MQQNQHKNANIKTDNNIHITVQYTKYSITQFIHFLKSVKKTSNNTTKLKIEKQKRKIETKNEKNKSKTKKRKK